MNATTLHQPAPSWSWPPALTGWLSGGIRRVPKVRAVRKAIQLDRDHVLRIDDGWGMTLSAASGVVWLTEESSPEDVVLAAGATHRIGRAGATVAVAHRAARVILEVPPGTRSPRRVELARADGAPGIMVTLGSRARLSLSTLVTAAAIALRRRLRRTPTTDRGVSPDAGWSRARAAIARDDPFPYY